MEQIQHFFEHYKDLEPGKWVKLLGWGDVEEAKQLISDAIRRARASAETVGAKGWRLPGSVGSG
jgi:inorganic pyrophosphatase